MNFIRNIISEKRAARPEIAPPAPVLEPAFVAPAAAPDLPRYEAPTPKMNIFAADVDEVESLDAADLAEDDVFVSLRDLDDDRTMTPQAHWPAVDEPVPETRNERRLDLASMAEEYDTPAPLVLGAGPGFRPIHEPTNQRSLNDMPFVSAAPAHENEEVLTDAGLQMPPPAAGRGASRSGRVKTRLLGFNPDSISNPFERAESKVNDTFPVGWLVVVAGPGLGASFSLHDGVSRVGRGEDQTVCLNFGDNSISRENHISIAFDAEQNAFYVGQSGRSNIVRLNNKPLLSTEQVRSGDQIRVGETTLRLVTLCGDGFSWAAKS